MIPLSTAMRPGKFEEFIGQRHFFYEGSLLYNAVKNKAFQSAIFFGPSGTGKTTLARLIAEEMDSDFQEINASETGIKELRLIIDNAKVKFFGLQKTKTYLYIDEFHRWNKLQQDSLLKALEEGTINFIGSTTENPYFAINNAVLSRVRSIYEFKRLETEDIISILENALKNKERGLGHRNISVDKNALKVLAEMSGGDARIALDTLGFIADNAWAKANNAGSLAKKAGGKINIDLTMVGEAMQRQTVFYDRKEDKYNLLSALQKSIRGSDPDAAIHYLARLIEGEGDLMLIGRRLMVIASEDVGMANPQAISIVTSCVQSSLMVGLPEARIMLAQAVILLASSPKSNSAIVAIDEALSDLKMKDIDDVPLHLKDSHYDGAKDRGIGIEYKYPHAYGGYVNQQYLPDSLHQANVKYYKPTENGREAAYKKFLEEIRGKINGR